MRAIWMKAAACLAMIAMPTLGCGRRQAGAEAASTKAVDTLKVTLTYEQGKGHRLFIRYCATCHGSEGAGDGFNAYSLNPKPRDLSDAQYQRAVSDGWLTEIVAQGGRGVNRSPLMPAYGRTLTKDQIQEVVAFIRVLPGRRAPS